MKQRTQTVAESNINQAGQTIVLNNPNVYQTYETSRLAGQNHVLNLQMSTTHMKHVSSRLVVELGPSVQDPHLPLPELLLSFSLMF